MGKLRFPQPIKMPSKYFRLQGNPKKKKLRPPRSNNPVHATAHYEITRDIIKLTRLFDITRHLNQC